MRKFDFTNYNPVFLYFAYYMLMLYFFDDLHVFFNDLDIFSSSLDVNCVRCFPLIYGSVANHDPEA